MRQGFTLIELSIVLVIIGLIVGALLYGRDLIQAAAARAQVSQFQKYDTAVNVFVAKYNYLPGDIPNPIAGRVGFAARGSFRGEGDGNGILEGIDYNTASGYDNVAIFSGELAMFWVDLSAARMIGGSFTTATPTALPGWISGAGVAAYFPPASIGNGNYIVVHSGGWGAGGAGHLYGQDSSNYFAVAAITSNSAGAGDYGEEASAATTITVAQAYSMDSKIDDGMPQSGRIMAINIGSSSGVWAAGGGLSGDEDPAGGPVVAGDGVATAPSPTTCYDNSNVAGATEHYSIKYMNGVNPNCGLTFRMQGGAR